MSADTGLEFVDTNVLVYAQDPSSGRKCERAQELVKRLWDEETGCLSVQTLQEFYVTVTRKMLEPLRPEEAQEILRDLCFWKVHAPQAEDVFGTIDLQRRYQLSFWDAMIVHSAIQLSCGVIWSEDLSDGQVYEGVRVVNPFKSLTDSR